MHRRSTPTTTLRVAPAARRPTRARDATPATHRRRARRRRCSARGRRDASATATSTTRATRPSCTSTRSCSTSIPCRSASSPRANPRVLPWFECPEAAGSARRLVGDSLDGLRAHVRAEFVGASTCTHLNDALRALEDVPALCTPPVMDPGPSVSTPPRPPGSTCRTTSIDMDMSDGQVLVGRARDLVTPHRGDAVVVDEASFTARVDEYSTRPGHPGTLHVADDRRSRPADRPQRRRVDTGANCNCSPTSRASSGTRSISSSTTCPVPHWSRDTHPS